ncbi:MAG: hypothetical protein EXS10_04005 [Phycisphaerales bacterium]|nr:hypothetical protein [Phycisphaerales bacterium]
MRFVRSISVCADSIARLACAFILLCAATSQAFAEVRPTGGRPIAVPGGVMLVAVVVEGRVPGSISAQLRCEGAHGKPTTRRALAAQLAWIGNGLEDCAEPRGTRWAGASNAFGVSATKPTAQDSGAAACVFVSIPLDAALGSAVEIDGHLVQPAWFTAADPALLARIGERISKLGIGGIVDAREARPDPRAPFERFRWTLGVALRGWEAPASLHGVSQLAALQCESLWLAALARLERTSAGAACEVAEHLIATVVDIDRNQQVAAWISDVAELNALLALMLDGGKSDAEVVESVVTWNRVRAPVLIWTEREDDDAIVLGFANPTADELVLPMQWLGEQEPPVAAVLAPGSLTRLAVAFPKQDSAANAGLVPGSEHGSAILLIRFQGEEMRLPFRISAVGARVPGVALRPFFLPLDLPSVATSSRTIAPPTLQTEAHLRKRESGWEMLVICRCASNSDATTDRIEINAGESGSRTVYANGRVERAGTTSAEATAGIEVRRFEGEWRASLQIPAEWIADSGTEQLLRIGVRRHLANQWADAPTAAPPWSKAPITVTIDLAQWR